MCFYILHCCLVELSLWSVFILWQYPVTVCNQVLCICEKAEYLRGGVQLTSSPDVAQVLTGGFIFPLFCCAAELQFQSEAWPQLTITLSSTVNNSPTEREGKLTIKVQVHLPEECLCVTQALNLLGRDLGLLTWARFSEAAAPDHMLGNGGFYYSTVPVFCCLPHKSPQHFSLFKLTQFLSVDTPHSLMQLPITVC